MDCPAAKFNFSALTDTDFLSKAESILKCMEGRPDFPEIVPSTAQIRKAFEDYKIALTQSNSQKKFSTLKKISKRSTLENLLIKLPAYCNNAVAEKHFKRSARSEMQSAFAF